MKHSYLAMARRLCLGFVYRDLLVFVEGYICTGGTSVEPTLWCRVNQCLLDLGLLFPFSFLFLIFLSLSLFLPPCLSYLTWLFSFFALFFLTFLVYFFFFSFLFWPVEESTSITKDIRDHTSSTTLRLSLLD